MTTGLEPIKISEDASGVSYYEQGNLKFPIEKDSLVRTLEGLDKLNSGTWTTLANLNHVPAYPFDRKLLKPVLMGIVQLAWVKHFEPRDEAHLQKLEANAAARLEKYLKDLEVLKSQPEKVSQDGRKVGMKRTAQAYELAPGVDVLKFKGQKLIILQAMERAGCPLIASAIADLVRTQITTKQGPERVVAFYMNEFQKNNIVTVVGKLAPVAPEPVPTEPFNPDKVIEDAKAKLAATGTEGKPSAHGKGGKKKR